MTYKEKKQAKKLKLEKDNKYLLKEIFKLSANKSNIIIRIKAYRIKHTKNDKCNSIYVKRLVKVLGVNQRTIYLLVNKEFFQFYFSFVIRMFNIVEVEKFIKSLPLN
jgi:hypothetical protein